jgi:hypothetical protein
METILPQKINEYRSQREMKKMDAKIQTPQNKDKLFQETQLTHKNTLKEEILQVINENFIQMILDMVNQNIQEALKKFQGNKNKEYEKA